MDPVKLKLKNPIDHEGETISELSFKEITLGDLIAAEAIGGGDRAQTASLIASSTGVPIPAIKKLSATDTRAVLAAAAPFLGMAE